MTGHDPFAHFVEAQAQVFDQALAELKAGRKKTHWMWYVFPQIAGLGHSAMAQRYALSSLDEARNYLAHPVLGPRLKQAAEAVLSHAVTGATARSIFGRPDDLKFHSSLTLFRLAAPGEKLFKEALEAYFQGRSDPGTTGRV